MEPDTKIRVACRRYDWTEALFDGAVPQPSLTFTEAAHRRLPNLVGQPPSVDFMEYGLGELL